MPLLALPEEILERIVDLLSQPDLVPVLSTHHTLARIATPLLYHTLTLANSRSAALLSRTLSTTPNYAHHTRVLIASATYPGLAPIFQAIGTKPDPVALETLDLTLDAESSLGELDLSSGTAVGAALSALTPGPHTLLLRRRSLHTPHPERRRAILCGLASALPTWPALSTFHTTFRLAVAYPEIVGALAHAPGLRCIRTPFPPTWTPYDALLRISENKSMRRIELTVARVHARARAAPVFVPVSDAGEEETEAGEGPALRGPIEVTSRLGRFYDRTPRTLLVEDVVLTAEDIHGMLAAAERGDEGVSAWLEEARTRPRLMALLVGNVEEDGRE